mmetsp:Transcript_8595/g.16658  ORF Transcript_8595/g.16658 Transcript_8595/m.16658 type:complete len:145 (-) Transcript_8595:492-926(-)
MNEEGLQMSFLDFCKKNIKTLSVEKATRFVNTQLLRDLTMEQMGNLRLPVAQSTVHSWMKKRETRCCPEMRRHEFQMHQKDGHTMVEHHVDDCDDFMAMREAQPLGGRLSVRMPPGSRWVLVGERGPGNEEKTRRPRPTTSFGN